jgi:UDP-glucose 4-epimerase
MKKVIVTGGAGFIGSHLTDELIKDGYQVAIVDNLSSGRRENINKEVKFYRIDICDKDKILEVVTKENPLCIFHLAAQTDINKSATDPELDKKINIGGSINVIKAAEKNNVKNFIFASSAGVYGDSETLPAKETDPTNPPSVYGRSKLFVEKYLKNQGKIKSAILRYSNVYGPRQNSKQEAGVVAIFTDKMINGKQPILYGDGSHTRDFIFVADVVEANIVAFEKGLSGIFNVGTARETSINQLFDKLAELSKMDIKKKFGPEREEQKRSSLDFSKLNKAAGWLPRYSVDDGLKETIKFFKNRT